MARASCASAPLAWWLLLATVAAIVTKARGNTCYQLPSQTECSTFEHPDAASKSELASLCSQMDWMPGCAVDAHCRFLLEQAGGGALDPVSALYCEPFSVLADVCAYDMPGMSGCRNYTSLCGPDDSKVNQCEALPPIAGLPTTDQAISAVQDICNSHFMSDCAECNLNTEGDPQCNILDVYSRLCLVMPDMNECGQWKAMCTTVPTWSNWCPSSNPGADQPPIMRMYFHLGIVDYVLFKGWVPRTNGEYVGTMLAIIVMAVLYEALKTGRHYLECRWAHHGPRVPADHEYTAIKEIAGAQQSAAAAPVWAPQPFRWRIDLVRSTLHMLEAGVSYLLMLIAMTFNVGLFLAVLAGLFIGSLCFGRFRAQAHATSC